MKFPGRFFIAGITTLLFATSINVHAQSDNDINNWMSKGSLHRGEVFFEDQLNQTANNENRFKLGTIRFIGAIERLAQGFYQHGLSTNIAGDFMVPFLRLPVPPNPNPDTITPDAMRAIFQRFYEDMESVDMALQQLDSESFKVSVALGQIGLDIDNNGQSSESERFHHLFAVYNRNVSRALETDKTLNVSFDLADAYWLRGYSHLLMGILDATLALDWGAVYEQSAHLFFTSANTSITALVRKDKSPYHYDRFVDAIATLHVMNLPVIDSDRLARSRTHLKETIQTSRTFWQLARQETDNDREWLPNSQQTSITGNTLSEEMITGWHEFLDEADDILDGNKLVPHWRVSDGRGVNIEKVFNQSTSFDPVLWIQGSAAIPYLENGELTNKQTWRRLQRLFRGNFIGFAVWIN